MSDVWHDNCNLNHGEYQGDECPSCADDVPRVRYALAEALHLFLDGKVLSICDAQLLPHVTFTTAHGDPCEWSRTIVEDTCKALCVTAAWVNEADDADESTLNQCIDKWHGRLGADDGFLP